MYIPKRYFMVLGTFIISMLLYIDRISISAVTLPLSRELNFTNKEMGWILSSFAIGYAMFQVPWGMLSDRYGTRKVLAAILVLWSTFTGLTGLVKSLSGMLIVRFLFGASEAGAFPSISRAIFSWIPMKERGVVNGINFAGARIGAAIALPFVAWMVQFIGWRGSFQFLFVIGIVFGIIWFYWFRNDPADCRLISKKELYFIKQHRQQTTNNPTLSFKTLLKSKNMMRIMLQYFSSNFTFFFCMTWLYPHIQSHYQLSSVTAAFYSSIPLWFGVLGNWFSGWWMDRIYIAGKWSLSRKIPAITGFSLAIVGLLGSILMHNVTGAIVCFAIALFGVDMTLSPAWSLCIDIGREHSGAVSGSMNMAGNLGSFITALAFPYLYAWTGSVVPFFIIGAYLNLVAIIVWVRIKPDISIA